MKPGSSKRLPSAPDGDPAANDPPPPGGMRMAELSRRSGIARETIHFYLREGLLPRPRKGGRTVAYYDEEHLERLRVIRRLRDEKYLPLAVIRRLLDSPAAAAERDVDALAEVMKIDPTLARAEGAGPPASPSALAEALALGLLGPPRAAPATPEARPRAGAGAAPADPTEARVLAIVDDALRLEPAARRLTLEDLEVCARMLTGLVSKEAELFFDAVIRSSDVVGTIAALRGGRGVVARFITAYRDLMLRRIVDDLLLAIQHGHEIVARAATIPLSAGRERDLGAIARRAELRARLAAAERARRADPEAAVELARAASELTWHLFATGAVAELAALPPHVVAAAGARAAVLAAWGAYESARGQPALAALVRAADAAPDFALGQILAGEANLARGQRRRGDAGASLLEDAVPALHRLAAADPARDPEPLAQALGAFHRGRVDLALPHVLGRNARGAAALEQAIALVEAPRSGIEPAAAARIAVNAKLALGRHLAAAGDAARARALLESAIAIDPEGPIADLVRSELGTASG